MCWWCMAGPTEGYVEERLELWNGLDWFVNRVGNGYKLLAGRSEWAGWR